MVETAALNTSAAARDPWTNTPDFLVHCWPMFPWLFQFLLAAGLASTQHPRVESYIFVQNTFATTF
jgi:hypothetical protein